MNYQKLKSYMAEFVFIIYLFIVYFFKLYDSAKFIDIINICFFTLLGIICYFIFGFSKCRKKEKDIVLKTVIIWILIYYFLTYMSGMVFGFLLSPYSTKLNGILLNIIPSIILIILQEIVRYMIIRVNKNSYLRISIITVLLIAFDIIMALHSYSLANLDGILDFTGLVVLYSISKGILLSYLSCKSGYVSNIVYRLLFETLLFVLQIFPDFSPYLESVIKIAFPILLLLRIDVLLEKYENRRFLKKERKNIKVIYLLTCFILIILVSLISGIFKYHLIAIGSGSMVPTINVGDAIIIEKLSKDELSLLNEGDLLVFENGNEVIVHRIMEIRLVNDTYQFITKGDANNSIDDFIIMEDDVIGITNVRIPYIGLPSVWLHEML